MEIKAHAKFLRLSPRKTRMVLRDIRGKRALEAVALLKLTPQKSSREVVKILNSAIANAQNNFGISKNDLVIKSISADIGPTFKRYKPRARGSADVIKRKMTHLSVILESVPVAKKKWLRPKVAELPTAKAPEKIKEGKIVKETKHKETPKEKVVGKEEKTEPKKAKILKTKKTKTEEKATSVTPKEKVAQFQKEEKKPKEKFTPSKKEGLFGGIKKFFRRKGF